MIRTCYWCSLYYYNLYISICFAVPLKQVNKSYSRHTQFLQSTLDAQERYPPWKGKKLEPMRIIKNFFYPVYFHSNSKILIQAAVIEPSSAYQVIIAI